MIMKSVGVRAGDLLMGTESVMCCAACARNGKAGEASRVDVDVGIVDVAHVLFACMGGAVVPVLRCTCGQRRWCRASQRRRKSCAESVRTYSC